MRIGVDSYSYHRYLGEVRASEHPTEDRWDHPRLLDEIVASGAEVASVETCYLPVLSETVLTETSVRLADAGVDLVLAWGHPEGLAGGHDRGAYEELRRLLPLAGDLGVELLRIVVGGPRQWQAEPEVGVVSRVGRLLDELLELARDVGVSLAIETHCELSLQGFADLVAGADGDLGVVLDTGNVIRIGATLEDALDALGPAVQMVHAKDLSLRDVHGSTHPGGTWWCTAVGDGALPIRACLATLVDHGFDGPVCVELMELDPAGPQDERQVIAESLANLAAWRADLVLAAGG